MKQNPNNDKPTKALVYCRVSSKKQKTGSGLESQEHRCREYAKQRGLDVEAVFPDDVSGGGDFMKRQGMVALLAYLEAQRDKNYVVIFDDLKRFARDTEFHIKLRRELTARGAIVECLNFKFEDTPEGRFIETVFAAHSELEREQNGRQVTQKMRARMEQGFWVFRAPVGYRYIKGARGGKELVFDETLAGIVKEALEGYASGRFDSQTEVQRFLESKPKYPKDRRDGSIYPMTIVRLLNKPIYAGYLECDKWGIPLLKAQHKGIISFADFQKIKKRQKEGVLAPARKNLGDDFALRRFVCCADCNRTLTSCWSKSKTGKMHPYYRCHYKQCPSHGKSIRRAKLEGDFEEVIRGLKPVDQVHGLTKAMFKNVWETRSTQTKHVVKALKEELTTAQNQIDNLLDRIVETTNVSVVNAYENKIATLEQSKLGTLEKIRNTGKRKHTFDDLFELAIEFLLNPWNLWVSGNTTLRRLVLRLAFVERVQYCRERGCLNPKKSLPFKMLEGDNTHENKMVLQEGIEPSTSSLPMKCSTTELLQPRFDYC